MFMRKLQGLQVQILICEEVLEAIFDECDKNDEDETGGRIIGFFSQSGNKLSIKACGIIGPGPEARRSPTSFFQDGAYQEAAFRSVEVRYPDIEHLGNWHTHHVNGLKTLSSGDVETYKRIVNHDKHNTDFFYALLVVAKNRASWKERYVVRHFLLRRGEDLVQEISSSKIKRIKEPALFLDNIRRTEEVPRRVADSASRTFSQSSSGPVRAIDKQVISETFPSVKAFFSRQADSLYWRGKIVLIDGTSVEIIVLESDTNNNPSYSIALSGASAQLFRVSELYRKRSFDSAWKAVWSLERDLNREIFNSVKSTSVYRRDE